MSANTQPYLFDLPPSYPSTLVKAVLVERTHLTFEQWRERIRKNEVIIKVFDLANAEAELRSIYLAQCWQDEYKWKEWCDAYKESQKD